MVHGRGSAWVGVDDLSCLKCCYEGQASTNTGDGKSDCVPQSKARCSYC